MGGRDLTSQRGIDAACDRFEDALRRGEEPDVAQAVAEAEPPLREALALELAAILAQWRSRAGEIVSVDAIASQLGLDPAALAAASGLPRAPAAGRFALVRELGAGSFGTTWLARDAALGRDVALKIAHAQGADDARFEREARAAARLRHEGIAAVHEALRVDGRPALVTELVPGRSLQAALAAGTFTPREAAALVAQVADALQHAHERGVVHRDVKPANVLVHAETGRPVLVDFGLAHDASAASLTVEGHVLGTPSYMSPEQARGDARSADERTDVHACGALLYELLTGRPPFPPGPALLQRVAHDEPVAPRRLVPSIDRDLEAVTLQALRKRPADRYATARDMAEDLRRWLDGRPVRARAPGAAERLARWVRRQPLLAGSLAAATLLLVALTIVSGAAARHAMRQRDEAVALVLRAQAAEAARLEQSFESRLAEAESHAWSSRPGRRFAALDAAAEAWRIQAALPSRADRVRRVRSAVLTALCLADMRPARARLLPPDTVTAAFSPDAATWAASDPLGTVRVFDGDDRVVAAFTGARDPVVHLEFSPDGARLLAVTEGRSPAVLIAWDWRAQREVARMAPAPWPAWTEEGRDVLVTLPGGMLGRLSLDDGALAPVAGLRGTPLATGPGGLVMLKDPGDPRAISVVDARTGRVRRRFTSASEPWVGVIDPHDGRWALTSSERELDVTSLRDESPPRRLGGHDAEVVAACASADGRFAATHGWDGVTRVWDVARGRLACSSSNFIMGAPLLRFSGDATRLWWYSDRVQAAPYELALSPPFDSDDVRASIGFAPGVIDVVSGPLLLAWAEPGATGRVPAAWDASARAAVPGLERAGATSSACAVPGGAAVLTASDEGVRAWTVTRESDRFRIEPGRVLLREPVREVAVSGDGRRFAAGLARSHAVVVAGVEDGAPVARVMLPRRSFTLALDERGELLAAGSWHERKAACVRVSDGRVLHEPEAASSVGVAFSPLDGSLLVHGGDELRRLDPITGAPRAARALGGGSDVPTRVAVSRAMRVLVVIDPRTRRDLRLLDPVTLEEIASLGVPALEGESLAWCAADAEGLVRAGSVSGRMFTWDLQALRRELASRGLDW